MHCKWRAELECVYIVAVYVCALSISKKIMLIVILMTTVSIRDII